jgi:hypothetical protein
VARGRRDGTAARRAATACSPQGGARSRSGARAHARARAQVDALLREQRSVVKRALQALGGRWLLRCLGVEEDWRRPARLDYVYDDDRANMAMHYIAAGAPVSLCGPAACAAPLPARARLPPRRAKGRRGDRARRVRAKLGRTAGGLGR